MGFILIQINNPDIGQSRRYDLTQSLKLRSLLRLPLISGYGWHPWSDDLRNTRSIRTLSGAI